MEIKRLIYIINRIQYKKQKFIMSQLVCIVLLLSNLFASLFEVYILGQIINFLIVDFKMDRVLHYIFLFAFLTAICCLTSYCQVILTQKFGKDISLCLKNYLYCKILNKRIPFWSNYTVGELETILVNDVNKLEYIFTNLYTKIGINILNIIGVSILIIAILRLIGIGLIGIVILTIVIQRLFMKKIETLSNEVRKLSGTTAAVETESLTKSEDIFMSGFQNNFLEKAYSCNSDLFQKIVKRNMFHALSSTATTILQTFSLIMILCVGGILINAKYISVDIGISMYIYIQKLSSPINQLINQIMNMMEIRPSIDKIIALIDNKDDIMWGKVQLRNVKR